MSGPSDDLSHITGSCARCERTGLTASEFLASDLKAFLAEQTSARGRSTFVDARSEVHHATRKVEVAGARLFCRSCVEAENSAAAAADTAWNESDDAVASSACAEGASAAAGSLTMTQADDEVADSWEDDL